MELKQFTKSALKDILEAVNEVRAESDRDIYLDTSKEQRTVEFDVAVTVEDATSSTGKAGVKIFQVVEGGGGVSKERKNLSVSRIKFGVYVSPSTDSENTKTSVELEETSNKNITDF